MGLPEGAFINGLSVIDERFLAVFDQPTPASSVGRRDETNVPAQSLTLLNDPFVLNCAKAWDERFEGSDLSSSARIDRMYQEALGRSPNEVELKTWSAFLTQRVSEQAEHRLAKEAATRALSKAEERWHSLVEQGKASVLESRGRENQPLEKDLPQAFSVWTFEDNAGDEYGRHDLTCVVVLASKEAPWSWKEMGLMLVRNV